MNRDFACGCSDETVAEAEGWLREVLPGLEEGAEAIRTGETRSWTLSTGEVHEYPVHREMDFTEALLLILEEEGNKRATTYSVSIGSDQWCGVSVQGKSWASRGKKWNGEDYPEGDNGVYGAKYDYGLLPYALAACVLQIRERFPVEEDGDG